MKRRDLFGLAAGALALAPTLSPTLAAAQPASRPSPSAVRAGYAEVGGLRSYYEIHGAGRPLVLLHGGLMTIPTMQPLLGALARTRQVVAVELEGHGRSVDLDRPLSVKQMARDLDGLMGRLDIARADVLGYSMGAGVAMRLAAANPGRVRRLVLVSAAVGDDAIYPSITAQWPGMNAEMMKGTPMEAAYRAVAPDPARFPRLIEKMKASMIDAEPWTDADIAAVKAPVLLVVGDADLIRPEAALGLFRQLGGAPAHGGMGPLPQSQFAILPSTTHFNIITRLDLLMPMTDAFLDAEALPPPQPTQPEF